MPESEKNRKLRQLRHRHNGFSGSAWWTHTAMNSIIVAPTTTEETKNIAKKIQDLTFLLRDCLRTRIDPDV